MACSMKGTSWEGYAKGPTLTEWLLTPLQASQ